jgi:hypothetical protein
LRDLADQVTQERMTTATLLAHLAEVDARRLYVPAGYASMHAYCVGALRLSEDAAYKRIQAARAGRQFPILFEELSNGRLHLAAVCLLVPHLTPENAGELIAAAVNRTKSEVEEWLARRFMDSRAPILSHSTIRRLAPPRQRRGLAIGDLLSTGPLPCEEMGAELAPGQVGLEPARLSEATVSGADEVAGDPMEREPQLVERFEVRVTIDRATYERLRYAQTILSHAVPDGDLGQILGRAVEALIAMTERRKFGATRPKQSGPDPSPEAATRAVRGAGSERPTRERYIPSNVRRAVWQRDEGRCTFVGASGHRCQARRLLEFDHVEPVARGGMSTVDGLRLRCRAHNQYEAELAFGRGFMDGKRAEARCTTRAGVSVRMKTGTRSVNSDVVAGLRNLGCRSDEARRAAEYAESVPGATVEEKMRAALRYLQPRRTHGRLDSNRATCPGAS